MVALNGGVAMKFAADFRKIAREALERKWKIAVLACLVAVLLGGAGLGGPNIEFELENSCAKATIEFLGNTIGTIGGDQSSGIGKLLLHHGRVVVTCAMIIELFYFLLGSVIELGYTRFCLNLLDRREPKIKDLFGYFFVWKKAIAAMFLQVLYILFWLICFIVSGIIAMLDYSMTSYILAEHPELSANEAIKRSKELMKGNCWRLFCLETSFIGWTILCSFTLGIGHLWLIPYRKTATAAFYREISSTWDEALVFECVDKS